MDPQPVTGAYQALFIGFRPQQGKLRFTSPCSGLLARSSENLIFAGLWLRIPIYSSPNTAFTSLCLGLPWLVSFWTVRIKGLLVLVSDSWPGRRRRPSPPPPLEVFKRLKRLERFKRLKRFKHLKRLETDLGTRSREGREQTH